MNYIISRRNYAIMEVYDKQKNLICRCKIDKENIEDIIKYKWTTSSRHGYLFNASRGLMHRYILKLRKSSIKNRKYEVDHINKDKLDNRKKNLRVVTHMINMRNIKMYNTNKSGITGVHKENRKNSNKNWTAKFNIIPGIQKRIGYFYTKKEAIQARKSYEKKYWGV